MKKIFIISIILLLSSCAAVQEFRQDVLNQEKPLAGNRIAVIEKTELKADLAAIGKQVILPQASKQINWLSSDLLPIPANQNILYSGKFKSITTIDFGKAADKYMSYRFTPVIVDGYIYLMDKTGYISAFDEKSRKKIWSLSLHKEKKKADIMLSSISHHEGYLYVSTGDNSIYAIDAKTGQIKWQKYFDYQVRSIADFYKNKVIIRTFDNSLYALNKESGKVEWVYIGAADQTAYFGMASAKVSGNLVATPDTSGDLTLLRAEDGYEIWGVNLAKNYNQLREVGLRDIKSSPIFIDKTIYIAGKNSSFAAIDINSGNKIWETKISSNKSPLVIGDFLVIITDDNQLTLISRKNGAISWVKNLAELTKSAKKIKFSAPLVINGSIFIASNKGELLEISIKDGSLIETRNIAKDAESLSIAGDKLYILTNNGKVEVME